MYAALGEVVFSTWQGVLLILLCFGSLLIALYCLLFMVPLKSFVNRINLLGGGVRGIRAYVDGMRSENEERIAALEDLLHEQLSALRAEMEGGIESGAASSRQAEAHMQQLERTVQTLRAELGNSTAELRKLPASLDTLRRQLGEVRNDFEVLEAQLAGSVRKLVADSYQQIEGTVLSALGTVQDEMLRGSSELLASREPKPHGGPRSASRFGERGLKSPRLRGSRKIIPAAPLFPDVNNEAGKADSHAERPGAEVQETNEPSTSPDRGTGRPLPSHER